MISGEFILSELSSSNGAASPRPGRKTAADRIAALKAAGVDVSNYFPMGDDMIVRVDDGVPSQVLDDDPVFAKIASGGYINSPQLYRRWVMAQMFRILRQIPSWYKDFTEAVQHHGYNYSWRMLERELLAQAKMARHGDTASFRERNRWFNRNVAKKMADDYIAHLDRLVDGLKVRHCKRRPYKRVCGENIFTDELEAKLYAPVSDACVAISLADTPQDLLHAVRRFNRLRKRMPWTTKMAKAFIDAYKGAGAYFTMKNLILFHGARFSGHPSERQSLEHMERLARECEGWELLGAMKQLISDSGISVEKKVEEWRRR